MLKFAPRNPQERFETIDTGWRQLGHESSEFLQGAGIRISRSPLLVYGKILPLPEIKYGSGFAQYVSMIIIRLLYIHYLQRDRGAWTVQNQKLARPAVIKNLLFINFTGKTYGITTSFSDDLCVAMKERGIT